MDNAASEVKLLMWNACSIRHKVDELLDLVNNLRIDIILLSETHLDENTRLRVPGFDIHRNDRPPVADRKTRPAGGTAILTRQGLLTTRLPTPVLKNMEATVIRMEINSQMHTIIAAYCPSGANNIVRSDLDKLLALGTKVLIGGDFNSKHRNWNNFRANKNGNILFKHLESHDYTVLAPDKPTYYKKTMKYPSTLDIALAKNITTASPLMTLQELPSDHLPVSFSIGGKITRITRTQLDFQKADWKKFKERINEQIYLTSETLTTPADIDEAVKSLTDIIQRARDDCIPNKKIQPFIVKLTPHIKFLITEKNRLRRIYQNTHERYFKIAVNTLGREIKDEIAKLKNTLWSDKVTSLSTQDNSIWKMSKALRYQDNSIPPLKWPNSTTLALSNEEKANTLADGFEKAYKTTDGMDDPDTNETVNKALEELNLLAQTDTEDIKLSTPKEVAHVIRCLKAKKAPGEDQITNTLLKNLPQRAIIFITKIFNACLLLGHFPSSWKNACVLPFHKAKKERSNPSCYRPISLLPTLSKVLEQIILNRYLPHHENNKTLPDEQFGFRRKHSTVHQLTRVTEDISRAFNTKKYTAMALLDLEKAFDTVWMDGLIYKLYITNTPIYIIRIIQDYLKNRSFAVKVGEATSTKRNVPKGVPQGSLLGPHLFNLYTYDIPPLVRCKKAIYADDMGLYATSSNAELAVNYLQRDLNELSAYYKKWRLKLNEAKTEVIMFTRRVKNKKPQKKITMSGVVLEWKTEVKYLGLTLDCRLNWKSHLEKARSKMQQAIGAISPIFNRKSPLAEKKKLLLYQSQIRPALTYAIPVWSNIAQTTYNRLQTLQNKCIKIIYNTPRYTNLKNLHDRKDIPTIQEHSYQLTTQFYKTLNRDNPLIKELGNYDSPDDLPFRYKHKMPKHLIMKLHEDESSEEGTDED